MRIHSLVIDNFLRDYWLVLRQAMVADYVERLNPANGLTYPGVSVIDSPDFLEESLHAIFGPVRMKYAIYRLSTAGTPCPELAHADTVMGNGYSLICYLNQPDACQGGTSLLRHIPSGLEEARFEDAEQMGAVEVDSDKPQCWERTLTCPMRTNRAFIYRSEQFHQSEPLGGFGSDVADGRLVIAGFFEPT